MSTVPPLTCLKDFLAPQQFLVADACYDFINGYRHISGTSEAAPFVAGAAAVILAKNPGYTNQQVIEKLKNSALPMPGQGLGDGALNIFDAVFNGNFELEKEDNENRLAEWEHSETNDAFLHCKGASFFGEINPTKGDTMLSCGTQGVYEYNTSIPSSGSYIKNRINLPEGVTHLPLSFKWKVASVDLSLTRQPVIWDDRITIRLRRVDDSSKEVILFDTSLNHIMQSGRNLFPLTSSPYTQV